MAPALEPKKRVKSIKKPVKTSTPKIRKLKGDKQFSKTYINILLKKVLRKRLGNSKEPVYLIYNTYRRLIKSACKQVARRNEKITIGEAHIAMAKMIPRDLIMNAIKEFREQQARDTAVAAPPANA